MKKNEFFSTLNKYLSVLPEDERIEIISDFEEHFNFEFEKGKKEEEIVEYLGNPDAIAKQFLIEKKLQQSDEKKNIIDMFKTIKYLASVSDSTYKISFVGFVSLFLLSSIVALGLFLWGLAVFLSSVGLSSLSTIVGTPYISLGSDMFLGIGILSIGVVAFIIHILFLEYFYKNSISSFKANAKNLKGGV